MKDCVNSIAEFCLKYQGWWAPLYCIAFASLIGGATLLFFDIMHYKAVFNSLSIIWKRWTRSIGAYGQTNIYIGQAGQDDLSMVSNFDIQFEQVSFSEGGRSLLENLSCFVPARSVTAIVGFPGSGENTLFNLITRFYEINSGKLKIGGVDVKKVDRDRLNRYITQLSLEVPLINDTIYNNIRLAKKQATEQEILRAASTAGVLAFSEHLEKGLFTVLERRNQLSAGHCQRLSVARALLKDAPIILLDEAITSFFIGERHDMKDIFSNLLRNKTVLFVARNLQTVVHVPQILVLAGNRLLESGTHEELLNRKWLYHYLWTAQNEEKTREIVDTVLSIQ